MKLALIFMIVFSFLAGTNVVFALVGQHVIMNIIATIIQMVFVGIIYRELTK